MLEAEPGQPGRAPSCSSRRSAPRTPTPSSRSRSNASASSPRRSPDTTTACARPEAVQASSSARSAQRRTTSTPGMLGQAGDQRGLVVPGRPPWPPGRHALTSGRSGSGGRHRDQRDPRLVVDRLDEPRVPGPDRAAGAPRTTWTSRARRAGWWSRRPGPPTATRRGVAKASAAVAAPGGHPDVHQHARRASRWATSGSTGTATGRRSTSARSPTALRATSSPAGTARSTTLPDPGAEPGTRRRYRSAAGAQPHADDREVVRRVSALTRRQRVPRRVDRHRVVRAAHDPARRPPPTRAPAAAPTSSRGSRQDGGCSRRAGLAVQGLSAAAAASGQCRSRQWSPRAVLMMIRDSPDILPHNGRAR